MGIQIKSKDGKQGDFDAAAYLQSQVPGAVITGYDKTTGQVSFKAGEKTGSFDAKAMLAQAGAEPTGKAELNSPEAAIDESPLTWRERFELGYLTRESSDFQRLISNVGAVFGAAPVSDEALKQNEKRAIKQLKTRYEDATVAGGELVVKQNGVWKKVDSSSDSIGADAAQLLGSSGLNILGSIAGAKLGAIGGSSFGPIGTAAGAVIGAVGGGLLGEVAEEATAVGIVGGEVDPQAAARDLMTEGILGMVGESVSGVLAKGAAKVAGPGLEAATKAAEIKAEATVVKGLGKVATTADSKVKDIIAQTYSTINPELSEAPLREAIDSADNMAKAHSYSKVARALPSNAPNPLLRNMATNLQDGVEGAMSKAEEKFGVVLQKIRSSVSDDFTIDLDHRVKDLQAAAKIAPKDKRAFFNVVENETKQLAEALSKEGEGAILKGRKALALVERQRAIINQKLKDTGAFDPQAVPGSEDRLLHKAMSTIKSYMDSELLDAAERTSMAEPFTQVKDMYRATKEAVETVWSKTFSNKRDITFAQNVAKGKVDANVIEAISQLNQLHPEAKIQSKLSNMRLMQAGIEMTPMLQVKELVKKAPGHALAASGAAFTGGVQGIIGAATVVSPRLASNQARMAARGSEMLTKNQLARALPQARAQARSLLGLAYTSGFVRTLNQANARALLTNPDLFGEFVNQSTQLSTSLANTNEDKVTEAAVKAAGAQ